MSLPALGSYLCLHGAWHAAVRPDRPVLGSDLQPRVPAGATAATVLLWQLGRLRVRSAGTLLDVQIDGRVQQQGWIPLAPQGGHGHRWARTQPPQPRPGEDPLGGSAGAGEVPSGRRLGPSAAISSASCQASAANERTGERVRAAGGSTAGGPAPAPAPGTSPEGPLPPWARKVGDPETGGPNPFPSGEVLGTGQTDPSVSPGPSLLQDRQ